MFQMNNIKAFTQFDKLLKTLTRQVARWQFLIIPMTANERCYIKRLRKTLSRAESPATYLRNFSSVPAGNNKGGGYGSSSTELHYSGDGFG